MIIIVGLGNPGEQYKNMRHNVGFMAIDAFAGKNNFPEFKLEKRSDSLISEKPFDSAQGDENIVLVKPQTFMNESGKAVKEILKNNPATNLIIIHDDVDLPVGKIKIVTERGSAGHKGVESVIQNIGNEGLIRFRIGVGSKKQTEAKKIVLKNFSKEEQKIIDETIQKAVGALDTFVKKGLDKTMNEYNK